MPEATELLFTHKELAVALVKALDLHEGIWGLHFKFGLGGANVGMGSTQTELQPTALVPVLGVGLRKFDEETNISVDAAKVNPAA